jgi:nicotinamide phosphoribosyltransferase
MLKYPSTLLCDFYKISHRAQYPPNTETVLSNWTPRGTRMAGVTEVVNFSLQAFIRHYFVDYFQENFFDRPRQEVIDEYTRVIRYTLNVENPDATHIGELHDLGYLPLVIRALPEGTLVPLRVPMFTIENTLPEFFWLTNYFETLLSSECWQPTTSATTAFEYRKLFERFAAETGADPANIPFQGHDFSFRGMPGLEAAAASGAGHLLSFVGTDTIPSIIFHEYYYGANIETELVGASIPATEHSVMCAYGKDEEFGAFKRLITVVYPNGFVSVVSDSFNLWDVLDDYIPRLRSEILARDGRLVIRPDSGDPVKIITGNPDAPVGSSEYRGVIETLWDIFGGTINDKGYKVLDPHIGAIYGDSISLVRAGAILQNLKDKGFASSNIVFGIGSYTYQYVTRDSLELALKATDVTVDGVEKAIFKDPITDLNHMKRSARGRVAVVRREGVLTLVDGLTVADVVPDDELRVVFRDGAQENTQTLSEIRSLLLSQLPA